MKSSAHRSPTWAQRVQALIQTGNQSAAVSQIKACAELQDVKQLERLLAGASAASSVVLQALADQLQELSHPRLHRSP
jgi:hypothetical protein